MKEFHSGLIDSVEFSPLPSLIGSNNTFKRYAVERSARYYFIFDVLILFSCPFFPLFIHGAEFPDVTNEEIREILHECRTARSLVGRGLNLRVD